MKKTLISIVAVALLAIMITNAYAPCDDVPPPPSTCGRCPGFTPGFWKHNIQVRLGEKLDGKPFNGAYSAFEGGPRDGEKLTDTLMDDLLEAIQDEMEDPTFSFEDALGYLMERGWSADRTNTANWFNWAADYGPYNG